VVLKLKNLLGPQAVTQTVEYRKPPVEAALILVTTPSRPTRAPVPLSVCSWLADTAHFDHAHRHRPAGQPVSITGQPASAAATVTDTTGNLVKLIVV